MPDPFVSSVKRRPRRLRRALGTLGLVAIVAGIPAVAFAGLWALDRSTIPPRTFVDGIDVSGVSHIVIGWLSCMR